MNRRELMSGVVAALVLAPKAAPILLDGQTRFMVAAEIEKEERWDAACAAVALQQRRLLREALRDALWHMQNFDLGNAIRTAASAVADCNEVMFATRMPQRYIDTLRAPIAKLRLVFERAKPLVLAQIAEVEAAKERGREYVRIYGRRSAS